MGCALSRCRLHRALLWHETAGDAWTRGRRCPVTPTSTSRSSAPASPACGPPTTSPRPTRRCGSWCSRPRSPGSARPAATAAGARRCSRPRCDSLAALRPAARPRSPSTRAMRATVDEVGRVAAAEGIDAHVAKGGTIALVRTPAQLAPGPRRGRRRPATGASARTTCGCSTRPRRAACCDATRTLGRDVHPRLRGDPPRAGWSAGWPRRSSAAASRIHEQHPGHRDRARPGR